MDVNANELPPGPPGILQRQDAVVLQYNLAVAIRYRIMTHIIRVHPRLTDNKKIILNELLNNNPDIRLIQILFVGQDYDLHTFIDDPVIDAAILAYNGQRRSGGKRSRRTRKQM